jgi:hypothetical protein
MAIDLFRLDPKTKKLHRVSPFSMESLHLTEANDLEEWLASCKDRLFGREILWIARQDRPSHEQRSDIIGVDKNGDLLIAELKRGLVEEGAITQALGYTAEYEEKSAEDLEELFFSQSVKAGSNGLLVRAESLVDAKKRLADHLGPEVEINETQIVIIFGEQFSAKALAICNYLNGVLQPDLCSFECWRYSVHTDAGEHFLAIEQLLPPPSARALIEERREESKSRKYARDPVRVAFMQAVMAALSSTPFKAERNRGQSYQCRITNADWPKDASVRFSVQEKHPALWVPPYATYDETNLSVEPSNEEGSVPLIFEDVEAGSAQYSEAFEKRLQTILKSLAFPSPEGASVVPPPS